MSSPGNNGDQVPFLSAELLTIGVGAKTILKDLSFTMGKGEHWILTGSAGVGKSTLGKALCGLIFHRGLLEMHAGGKALFVDQWHHFKDHSGLSSNFYYQQRYNSQDAESAVTVRQELAGLTGVSAPGVGVSDVSAPDVDRVLEALDLHHRADASLVQLSSGEHKKLQLARAFLTKPGLLVLDNPYLGLDAATCANLDGLFTSLAQSGTQLIIISDAQPLPSLITHVATLSEGHLEIIPKEAYQLIHRTESELPGAPLVLPAYQAEADAWENFVRMDNVHVQYGDKLVLDNINWTVKKGERWWLKGHNGAGKSTLLSLIVGDNPQAYANEIYLFDNRRGSGESIWDIKKKIGYISPELHWYFDPLTTCADAIATGYFDTTGLYRKISPAQEALVAAWMEVFELSGFAHKQVKDLSIGRQRMTLLARALVKNPPVLILDEPCQGLDDHQSAHFIRVIDKIMEHSGRTLLYVSHRVDQLPGCIDHLLALEGGRPIVNEPYHHTIKTVQR
jgi:molybdate transport system ATP-binding protein